MTDTNNTFSGFEAISDYLTTPRSYHTEDDDFSDIPIKDPSELEEEKEAEKDSTVETTPVEAEVEKEVRLPRSTPPNIQTKTLEEIKAEDEDIESTTEAEVNAEETTELKEAEPEIAAFVQERLYEKLGWEFDADEKKLQSIDEIVDYVQNLVDENSQPNYASGEIEELNNFVQNGGDIRNYFETKYAGNFDVEKADIEDPIVQTRILKEFYKEQGISEDRISKRIQRLEDTGILEEEAKDARDVLVKNNSEKAKKLLVEQENLRKEGEKQQQKLYEDVANSIRSTKEIMGVQITQAEKEKLIKDIFILGPDGKTNYQKKYSASIDNLIKSAFFTMYEDKLSQKVNNKATSEATQSLKKKLQSVKSGLRTKGSDVEETSTTSKRGNTEAFNSVLAYLQKPH